MVQSKQLRTFFLAAAASCCLLCLFCCDLTENAALLRDDYFLRIYHILRNVSDPLLTPPREAEEMRSLPGEHAQLLRLLWWIALSDAEARKEILVQWLVRSDREMDPDDLWVDFKGLVANRTDGDIAQRKREFEEAMKTLGKERRWRMREQKREWGNWNPDANARTGIHLLDELVDSSLSGRPFDAVLFDGSAQERKRIYEGLTEGPPVDPPDRAARGLLVHLWICEPDAALRKDLLLPRIEATGHPSEIGWVTECPDFWVEMLEPFLETMNDKEREERLAEIHQLRPPTVSDAEHRAVQQSFEEMKRRVQEAQERKLEHQRIREETGNAEMREQKSD